jgi:hypothetical protein
VAKTLSEWLLRVNPGSQRVKKGRFCFCADSGSKTGVQFSAAQFGERLRFQPDNALDRAVPGHWEGWPTPICHLIHL